MWNSLDEKRNCKLLVEELFDRLVRYVVKGNVMCCCWLSPLSYVTHVSATWCVKRIGYWSTIYNSSLFMSNRNAHLHK